MNRLISNLRSLTLCSLTAIGVIAAPQAEATETIYGETRGWTIVALDNNGTHSGCGMSRGRNSTDFVLIRVSGGWDILFPVNGLDGQNVQVIIDVGKFSDDLNAFVEGGSARAPISASFVELIKSGSTLRAEINGFAVEYSLRGTTAATLKVEECDNNQGRVAAAKPKAPKVVESEHLRMGANCPALGSFRSPDVQDAGDITFYNRSGRAVTVYWLDWNGQPVEMAPLGAGDSQTINSNAGHYFIAKDFDMTCRGGVIEVPFGVTDHEIW